MVQAWRSGAEVVTAVRDDRDAEGLVKVATASWFYRVFNRLVDSIQLQEGAVTSACGVLLWWKR